MANIADFNFSPPNPTIGDTVTFDASPSHHDDLVTSIRSYEWQILPAANPPVMTTTPTFQFTFREPGHHDMYLTVSFEDGTLATIAPRDVLRRRDQEHF